MSSLFFSIPVFSQTIDPDAAKHCDPFYNKLAQDLGGKISEIRKTNASINIYGFDGLTINCDVSSDYRANDGFFLEFNEGTKPKELWWKYFAIAANSLSGISRKDALAFGKKCYQKANSFKGDGEWDGAKGPLYISCSVTKEYGKLVAISAYLTKHREEEIKDCAKIGKDEYDCSMYED